MKAHVGFSQTPVSKEGWVFILVQGLPGPGSLKLGFFLKNQVSKEGRFFTLVQGLPGPGFLKLRFL